MRAFPKCDFAYLFVERKSEKDLCQTFKEELESQLGLTIYGEPERFTQIFEAIMRFAAERPITVVIDEFQETGWLIDGPNRDILYSRRESQRNIL